MFFSLGYPLPAEIGNSSKKNVLGYEGGVTWFFVDGFGTVQVGNRCGIGRILAEGPSLHLTGLGWEFFKMDGWNIISTVLKVL